MRVAGEVQRPRDAPARHLLEVDERLHRRGVAPAELGRVAGDHPAVVEQRRLPAAGPLGDDRPRRPRSVVGVVVPRRSPRAARARRGTRSARRGRPRPRGPTRAASAPPALERGEERRDAGSVLANRASRSSRRDPRSSTACRSSPRSPGASPGAICATPPCIFTTWPEMPSRQVGREPARRPRPRSPGSDRRRSPRGFMRRRRGPR